MITYSLFYASSSSWIWALSCLALLDGSLCSRHWGKCWAEFLAREERHRIGLFNLKKGFFTWILSGNLASIVTASPTFSFSPGFRRDKLSLWAAKGGARHVLKDARLWKYIGDIGVDMATVHMLLFQGYFLFFFTSPFSFIYFHWLSCSWQCIKKKIIL